MKILFAASECVPFCKTGGLADVIGSLPQELRKKRHDVRIILPKYRTIRAQEFNIKETGERVTIPMDDRLETADIRSTKTEKGVQTYFVNHEGYFGRSGLYRTSQGDYPDNAERFIFFCRAVLEACKAMEFRPDLIHCHDWQTGLIPAYLKTLMKTDAFFQHTASVITIHNMAYQGVFPKTILPRTGFSWAEFTMDKIEYYDQINFLKTGLVFADQLTTVSPTYARQIPSMHEFGRGLEGTLQNRFRDLTGILNGLDMEEWDPSHDPFLTQTFDGQSIPVRAACKAFLQKSLKLPVSAETPVLSMVSRLDPQKGVDLLIQLIPELMSRGIQLIVLGQGEAVLQSQLEYYEKRYPENIRVRFDFNDPLAHHIYAGSDIFLMPSRFEPCGLGQLIAMRYGAIPVVADTGGLRDTVVPAAKDSGVGFLFRPSDPRAFSDAVQNALRWFSNKAAWERLQARAMKADFSWESSAQAYLSVYRRALGRETGSRRRAKVS